MKNQNSLLLLFLLISSFGMANSIDVVYTWIDGTDPQWQRSLECHRAEASLPAVQMNRFRDRDELKYSLRSINDFAPWVNHIYIVTCGQKPRWFKDHPKITFIDHAQIFTNPDNLPTFNSMAIESNLHHIPNLSEQYLYFNDDVFLGQQTSETTFFTEEGRPKIFLTDKKLSTSPPAPGDEGFLAGYKNTVSLLTTQFGPKEYTTHAHTPYPTRKSFVEWTEKNYKKVFETVSSHRFRSLQDYTITNGIIPFLSLEKNLGALAATTRITVGYGKDALQNDDVLQNVLLKKPCFFCIQDSSISEDSQAATILHRFFEAYFPNPAPWETSDEAVKEDLQSTLCHDQAESQEALISDGKELNG